VQKGPLGLIPKIEKKNPVTNVQNASDPTLEIFDEVHESNPVNPLEDSWHPENMHRLQSAGGEQTNKYSQSY
jgi:hypothetical protein